MSDIINNNFIHNIIKKDLLKNPKKKINTRFPPEPNGYLHLGHAKAIFLNFNLAKKYNGTCNLRFDDTNPKTENLKYIKSIKKDIKWLGYLWNNHSNYTSQYFKKIYQYAKKLIKKNLAYVDQLNQIEIKKFRGTLKEKGINSPFRNQTIKKNLSLFKKMKNGFFKEGEMCLRAKINMKSNFLLLRDPVLYRIIYKNHYHTKKKWCIYPTYDFAHCISDALENITYSLCTLEFLENKKLYKWILKNLNFKKNPPIQYEYSRLNLEYSILSKRKIKILIKKKIIKKWNDPRLLTLSGLRKKGYTPNSINNFCEKIGFTKQNSIIQLKLLESCIRKDLNLTVHRKMAILNPVMLIITNYPKNLKEILKVKNHPTNKNMGFREILFSKKIYIEEEDVKKKILNSKKKISDIKIKLRYAYVIKIYKIIKDKNHNILHILGKYKQNTIGKKLNNSLKNKIIHWVSKKNSIPAIFKFYNKLFLKKNPEKEKNILNIINPNSYYINKGFVENSILTYKINTALQFERLGYFLYINYNIKKNFLIFNKIVSLKQKKYSNKF